MIVQTSKLELIEFDDLVGEEQNGHVCCATCYPNDISGHLVLALCGVIMRAKGHYVFTVDEIKCSECREIDVCTVCGEDQGGR